VRHDHRDSLRTIDEQAASRPLTAVAALNDAVRRRLYEYVSGCGEPVDREQAAAATGIGRPLAAYHLDKLVSLGLLAADYRRPGRRSGPGAGRPAKVYARSATEFTVTLPPREYELAARLLVDAVGADASGTALAGLKRAAREHGALLGQAAQLRRARHSGRDVLRSTEETLAAHGFEPVPDGSGGLRVRNCPFRRLADRDPGVVCAMNVALVEGIVAGLGASNELRTELDPVPGRCCVAVRAAAPAINPLERHDV
jgi:predicted ArsR family transcriptional regulator